MLCRNGHECDLGAPLRAEESLQPKFQQDLSRDKQNEAERGLLVRDKKKLVRHARGGSFTRHNDPTCFRKLLI